MRLPGGFYSEDETCEQSYMIHVTFRMHAIAEIRSSQPQQIGLSDPLGTYKRLYFRFVEVDKVLCVLRGSIPLQTRGETSRQCPYSYTHPVVAGAAAPAG